MKKSIGADTIIYPTLVLVIGTYDATGKTTSSVNLADDLSHWGAEALGNLIHRS